MLLLLLLLHPCCVVYYVLLSSALRRAWRAGPKVTSTPSMVLHSRELVVRHKGEAEGPWTASQLDELELVRGGKEKEGGQGGDEKTGAMCHVQEKFLVLLGAASCTGPDDSGCALTQAAKLFQHACM